MDELIHGYDYGTARAAHSPVTLDELRRLEQTVGWTTADDEAIAMAGEVLAGQQFLNGGELRARSAVAVALPRIGSSPFSSLSSPS